MDVNKLREKADAAGGWENLPVLVRVDGLFFKVVDAAPLKIGNDEFFVIETKPKENPDDALSE